MGTAFSWGGTQDTPILDTWSASLITYRAGSPPGWPEHECGYRP